MLTISDKPIISSKEVRKILGKEYEELTEEYLMGTIISMSKIASYFLTTIKVLNNDKVMV
jgi:hypothetical protein